MHDTTGGRPPPRPADGDLAATVRGDLDETRASDLPGAAQELPRGATLGRYVVLDRLGAGAMGVVYAAFDPELGRRVAIKVLRSEPGGESSMRLLREARALAQLSHPNVVAVHDVGALDQRVWLAMEFLEGVTLAQHWAAQPPRWREALAVMTRAGEGLAAAHHAGLVHRDFKPDNVMVSRDGRVRVMDLGLARRGDLPAPRRPFAPPELTPLSIRVTRAGAVLGTPAYMAPEQFLGAAVGPTADVFAYCVTFWEALYGQRPFAGDTFAVLAPNVIAGRLRAPPPGRPRVPTWLRRALERGLQVDPTARWPDMRALLTELARGQARARWRLVGLALALLALLAGAAWAWRHAALSRHDLACQAAGADIHATWNDDARAQVRAATTTSTTTDRLLHHLDHHADTWAAVRTEACRDGGPRGLWSPDTLDRALWCLDGRRLEFDALVHHLTQGGSPSLPRAVLAAASLEPPDPCRDPGLLARLPLPPLAGRPDIRQVRARLALARTLQLADDRPEGLAVARDALTRAEALAWPPLVAAARHQLGRLLARSDDPLAAESTLEAAYFEAAEADAPTLAFDAAIALLDLLRLRPDRFDDAQRWARLAHLALRPLAAHAGPRRADYLAHLALLHRQRGEHLHARAFAEQALDLYQQTLGPEHPQVALSLTRLADILRDAGDLPGALALDQRARAIEAATLGPDHPDLPH